MAGTAQKYNQKINSLGRKADKNVEDSEKFKSID